MMLVAGGCISDHRQGEGDIQHGLQSSLADEMETGRQIHASILSSFYPYTDQAVVAYVRQIGYSLAKHAERQDLPYTFTILYDDKIHAASAPGGYIYITTGMLNFLDNESELAAVLAHEIAELQLKDYRLSGLKKTVEGVTQIAVVAAPLLGSIGALAVMGVAAASAVANLSRPSSDKKVRQADGKALSYMVAAGYDPQGLIDLLYKFLDADKTLQPLFLDYYQARPITEKRFRSLKNAFEELPLENKAFSVNRVTYQDAIKGIKQIYQQ
jgi:predicted Zn-dependent protease